MNTLNFSIIINATPDHVWDTMLSDITYRQWTSAFNPGSYYEGDWSEGSRIVFLGPDPKNPEIMGGMVGTIAEFRRPEFVSIRYSGMISNGVEDTTSPEVQSWVGATESYRFSPVEGGTEVLVEMTMVSDEFAGYMNDAWPKALQKLKELVENQ